MYCSYYYRAVYGWKRITILGVFLIGITSLLYAVCCVLDYHAMGTLRDMSDDGGYNEGTFSVDGVGGGEVCGGNVCCHELSSLEFELFSSDLVGPTSTWMLSKVYKI